jgi:hypothetical protein
MVSTLTVTQSGAENTAGKFVLIYRELMPFSEYAALTNVLNGIAGITTVTVCSEMLDLGVRFANRKANSESLIKSLKAKFTELSGNYSGQHPEIFANLNLHYQFEGVFDEIGRASSYEEVFSAFLDLFNPALVIFAHEAFTVERTLVRSTKSRNVPAVSVPHGGLGHRKGYVDVTGDADIFLCWHDINYEAFLNAGIDKSRLKKIGCLRYEKIYADYLRNTERSMPDTRKRAKEHLGLSPDKPLIAFATAQINTGMVDAVARATKHRKAIREILSFVASRPDLQFLIKPHNSYDYYELYRRSLSNDLPNLGFVEPGTFSLNEVLEASDILVMVNYCTTAALESMLKRVPVIYFENAVYPIEDCQDNLSFNQLIRVRTVEEFGGKIDKLLADPEEMARALADADKLIKTLLDVAEGPASNRLHDFLVHALDVQAQAQAQATVGRKELLNAQLMKGVLRSTDVRTSLYREYGNAIKRSSNELQMYVFSYLAGMNNLSAYSVFKMYSALQADSKNDTARSWNEARWFLLPMYIAGNDNKPMTFSRRVSTVCALLPYMFSYRKLTSAPDWYKVPAFKAVLGKSGVFLIKVLSKRYHQTIKWRFKF